MDRTRQYLIPLSFAEITVEKRDVGKDIHLLLYGGTPHLGCTVLAQPTPREKGIWATASVINCPGHRDDFLCRMAAETFCRKERKTVVCSGGFHIDHLTIEQLQELQEKAAAFFAALEQDTENIQEE